MEKNHSEGKLRGAAQRTTTWIVPAAPSVNRWIRGSRDTVALRITRHADAYSLCLACNSAIVSTSANISGSPPVQRKDDLAEDIINQLDFLLAGDCGDDPLPSRIEDIISGEIVRS